MARVNGVGMRKLLACHHEPAAPHQVADQRRLPVTPHTGTGRQRVGLGECGQQVQQDRIAFQRVDDGFDRLRVLQVPTGCGVRKEEMVPHDLGEHLDVRRPQTEPGADLGGQLGADDAVVTAPALADVVAQRAEQQQVGPRHTGGECACPRDGLDEMTVDGPDVHDVAGRQITHGTPLREEPAPQSGAVERLDRGNRRRTRGQHHQQVLEGLLRPRCAQFGRGLAEPGQGGRRHRQAGARRGGGNAQDEAGVALGARVAGKDHFAAEFDDPLVQRSTHRSPERGESAARQRIGSGAHARHRHRS